MHVEFGSVSMRFCLNSLSTFRNGLRNLKQTASIRQKSRRTEKEYSFSFAGLPYQVVLSAEELKNVLKALDCAVSTFTKLDVGCFCNRNN